METPGATLLHAPRAGEARSPEELRRDYLIEKELAGRLRAATGPERLALYGKLYDEMYLRTPNHPQLVQKASEERKRRTIGKQFALVSRFRDRNASFLEVGPGDCSFAFAMCAHFKTVIGVDVSPEISRGGGAPANFRLEISNGVDIPCGPGSIDIVYSNQLMEHLHPEDARRQLEEIHRVLKPGGKYICITPSALSGPHDISFYFDLSPQGFHIREYTNIELTRLFREVGFRGTDCFVGGNKLACRAPKPLVVSLERVLLSLPARWQKRLARSAVLRPLVKVQVVGTK